MGLVTTFNCGATARKTRGLARLDDRRHRGIGSPTELRALFEVSAGTERPASASEDRDPDILVCTHPLQRFHEHLTQLTVQGVAYCRTIKRDDGHLISQIKE